MNPNTTNAASLFMEDEALTQQRRQAETELAAAIEACQRIETEEQERLRRLKEEHGIPEMLSEVSKDFEHYLAAQTAAQANATNSRPTTPDTDSVSRTAHTPTGEQQSPDELRLKEDFGIALENLKKGNTTQFDLVKAAAYEMLYNKYTEDMSNIPFALGHYTNAMNSLKSRLEGMPSFSEAAKEHTTPAPQIGHVHINRPIELSQQTLLKTHWSEIAPDNYTLDEYMSALGNRLSFTAQKASIDQTTP